MPSQNTAMSQHRETTCTYWDATGPGHTCCTFLVGRGCRQKHTSNAIDPKEFLWGAEQDEALHHQVLGKAVLKIKKWQFSLEYVNIISRYHRTKISIIAFCKVNDLEYSEVEFQYLQAPFLLSSENMFLCKPALLSMCVSPV